MRTEISLTASGRRKENGGLNKFRNIRVWADRGLTNITEAVKAGLIPESEIAYRFDSKLELEVARLLSKPTIEVDGVTKAVVAWQYHDAKINFENLGTWRPDFECTFWEEYGMSRRVIEVKGRPTPLAKKQLAAARSRGIVLIMAYRDGSRIKFSQYDRWLEWWRGQEKEGRRRRRVIARLR